MRVLQRIWDDVRRGENIDLYLTVVIAIGLGVLNLLGSPPQAWVTSATLAALGVLAISALRNEHHVEELQKLAESTGAFFLEEFPSTTTDDFTNATELWLVGVTLSRTIKTYYSTIEKKLRKGHIIKVLLVHPGGVAVEMAETRVYGRADVERTRADIRGVLQDLRDLRQIAPDKLEIRTIQNPLTYGAMAINPKSASGTLYLEHYPFKTEGGSKPKFILRPKDGRWYAFFRDEIQTLWNNGVEWKDNEKN